MSKIKISVIIPVFNVEKYLSRCLDSVINQTMEDIEIICINDGSTDNSLDILEHYSTSDSRIKIYSQENKGAGNARNNAIKHVSGEYLFFLDADDFLKPTSLKELYDVAIEKSVDFVVYRLINYDENTKEIYENEYYNMDIIYEKVKDNIFNFKELGNLIFKFAVTPTSKLYNTKFFLDNNFKFPEDIIFEDEILFYELLLRSEKIFFYPKHLYYRCRRNDSIISSKDKRYIDIIEVNNRIIQIFKEFNLYDTYKHDLCNKKVGSTNFRLNQVESKYANLFFNKIKEDYISISDYGRISKDFYNVLSQKNKNIFNMVLNSTNFFDYNISIKLLNLFESYNLKNMNSQIEHIKDLSISSNEKIEKLSSFNEDLITKIDELSSLRDDLVSENESLVSRVDELSSFKEKIILEKDHLNKLNNDLILKNKVLRKNNLTILENNEELENKFEKLDIELKNLLISYNKLQEENKHLSNYNNKLLSRNIYLKNSLKY
ncbi:glycosyltransferase [uncultured Methanobrevibacter sp.]|uniref:glycosyltransferase n=1 Tax=uncultured Methanobrevibacter sp. TaxID=253161 RepID=UPI00262A07E6